MTDGAKPRSVDDYLAKLPDGLRTAAQEVRTAIRSTEPEAHETVKWAQAVFEVNGPVAALRGHASHVTLTFWRGAALTDPDGILEGDGDQMRHVRFQDAAAVDHGAIGGLFAEAARLNRELGDPTRRARG